MRAFVRAAVPLALLLGLPGVCGGGGGIDIDDAWVRAAGAGGVSAVYLVIRNDDDVADALLSVTTEVAPTARLHRTSLEGSVARMAPLSRLEIPAKGTVALEPGGLHLMLMDLKRDLNVGEDVVVLLEFERAGVITVEAEVRAPAP